MTFGDQARPSPYFRKPPRVFDFFSGVRRHQRRSEGVGDGNRRRHR